MESSACLEFGIRAMTMMHRCRSHGSRAAARYSAGTVHRRSTRFQRSCMTCCVFSEVDLGRLLVGCCDIHHECYRENEMNQRRHVTLKPGRVVVTFRQMPALLVAVCGKYSSKHQTNPTPVDILVLPQFVMI